MLGPRRIEGSTKRRLFAVLHQPPVDSPQAAVRAGYCRGASRQIMNFRRGLFRIWILLSFAWSIGYFWLLHHHATDCSGYIGLGKDHCFRLSSDNRLWIVTPFPWLITAAVFGMRWAFRGFRAN
jgi:hypothetical protein